MRSGECVLVMFAAVATDAFAGAARVLADVQRLGLRIVEFRMEGDEEGGAAISMGLAAPADYDVALLSCRLARHPSLSSIELLERSSQLGLNHTS